MGRSLQIDPVSFEMIGCPWFVRYFGLAFVLDVFGPDAGVGTGSAIVVEYGHSSLLRGKQTELKKEDLEWWVTQCSCEEGSAQSLDV